MFGQDYYEERICDHVFRVLPTAFLQIHIDMCRCSMSRSSGCVRLRRGAQPRLRHWTIGIVRKRMPNLKVIGVEICADAVEDAKFNETSISSVASQNSLFLFLRSVF